MNVRELVNSAGLLYGGRPIIHFDGEDLSYASFIDLADRFASAFVEKGLKPGGRVMIVAKNSPEWIAAYFAVLACGGRRRSGQSGTDGERGQLYRLPCRADYRVGRRRDLR